MKKNTLKSQKGHEKINLDMRNYFNIRILIREKSFNGFIFFHIYHKLLVSIHNLPSFPLLDLLVVLGGDSRSKSSICSSATSQIAGFLRLDFGGTFFSLDFVGVRLVGRTGLTGTSRLTGTSWLTSRTF